MSADVATRMHADHQHIDGLCRRLDYLTATMRQREDAARALVGALSSHWSVERHCLYGILGRAPASGPSLARRAAADHERMERLMAGLIRLDAAAPDFEPTLRSVMAGARDHVDLDRREILPRLAAVLDDAEQHRVAARMHRAARISPTRPHPRLPASSSRLVAAGAGTLDRLRDTFSRKSASAIE